MQNQMLKKERCLADKKDQGSCWLQKDRELRDREGWERPLSDFEDRMDVRKGWGEGWAPPPSSPCL